jgi:copper chaperone CopZ
MDTVTLRTPSIHCRSCEMNIVEALEEVEGVDATVVDLEAKSVTVTFDEALVEPATIEAAIEQAGYPVEV